MKRIMKSLLSGVLITIGLFVVVILVDNFGGDSENPFLERTPFAWVFFWSSLFLANAKDVVSFLVLGFISNTIVYSILSYIFLWQRAMRKRLAQVE